MELLMFVVALCVGGFLARRFGYDSRATAESKEEDLAGFGMRWEPADTAPRDVPRAGVRPPVAPPANTSPPRRPSGRTVARLLRALTG
jgi:hypothetical protein